MIVPMSEQIDSPRPVEVAIIGAGPAGAAAAIHAAREDAHFVMHLHSDQGVAVSAHAEGLLPEGTTAEQLQSKGITAEQLAAAVGQKTAAWWDEVASKRNLPIAAVRRGA